MRTTILTKIISAIYWMPMKVKLKKYFWRQIHQTDTLETIDSDVVPMPGQVWRCDNLMSFNISFSIILRNKAPKVFGLAVFLLNQLPLPIHTDPKYLQHNLHHGPLFSYWDNSDIMGMANVR